MHFPHSWVWLDAKGEKQFDLTVIPLFDWNDVAAGSQTHGNERRVEPSAKVRLEGIVSRVYDTPLAPSDEPAGSRAYPIGGILGRVHVRKRTRVWIEEGPLDRREDTHQATGDKTTITVHGAIGERFDRQRIRVLCTDPKNRERIAQVFTNADGRFEATFDLAVEPTLEASQRVWKKAQSIQHGSYRVKAFIVAASLASEAESNELFIKR